MDTTIGVANRPYSAYDIIASQQYPSIKTGRKNTAKTAISIPSPHEGGEEPKGFSILFVGDSNMELAWTKNGLLPRLAGGDLFKERNGARVDVLTCGGIGYNSECARIVFDRVRCLDSGCAQILNQRLSTPTTSSIKTPSRTSASSSSGLAQTTAGSRIASTKRNAA